MIGAVKQVRKFVTKFTTVDWRGIFALPNIAALVISAAVITVAINSSGVMIKNYKLEKQIANLEQRVRVAQDEADKQRLLNQYYATESFLDIATRRQLTKGAPGEKLIIVPKNVALTYASKPKLTTVRTTENPQSSKSPIKNWFDFLSGKGLPD